MKLLSWAYMVISFALFSFSLSQCSRLTEWNICAIKSWGKGNQLQQQVCNNCFRKKEWVHESELMKEWMNEGTHPFQSQESPHRNPVYPAPTELESRFLRVGQTWMCVVLAVIYYFVSCAGYEALSSQLWTLPSEFCFLMLGLGLCKPYLFFEGEAQKVARRGTGGLGKEEGTPLLQIGCRPASWTPAVLLCPRPQLAHF